MNQPRRQPSVVAIFLSVITILIALVTLVSLAPLPLVPDLKGLGQGIIELATVVGAIAVIIGVLNLLGVHLGKLGTSPVKAIYSGITLLTFAAVLVLHSLEVRGILKISSAAASGEPAITLTLVDVLQVVIESALSGLLFFFLVYAAFRLMRRRVTIWSVIFLATLIIFLIGYVLPPGSILASLRDWVLRVPVGAGTRGLLIGIAIGTIIVGIRVLIGQDRLFRE
jgi:hypothetical protein